MKGKFTAEIEIDNDTHEADCYIISKKDIDEEAIIGYDSIKNCCMKIKSNTVTLTKNATEQTEFQRYTQKSILLAQTQLENDKLSERNNQLENIVLTYEEKIQKFYEKLQENIEKNTHFVQLFKIIHNDLSELKQKNEQLTKEVDQLKKQVPIHENTVKIEYDTKNKRNSISEKDVKMNSMESEFRFKTRRNSKVLSTENKLGSLDEKTLKNLSKNENEKSYEVIQPKIKINKNQEITTKQNESLSHLPSNSEGNTKNHTTMKRITGEGRQKVSLTYLELLHSLHEDGFEEMEDIDEGEQTDDNLAAEQHHQVLSAIQKAGGVGLLKNRHIIFDI